MNKLRKWYHDNIYHIRKASFSLLVVMVVLGLTTTFALHYFKNSSQSQEISEQYPPYPVYDVYGNPVEYDVVAPPENDFSEDVALAEKQLVLKATPEQSPDGKGIPNVEAQVKQGQKADQEKVENKKIEETNTSEKAVAALVAEEKEEPVLIPPLARPCNGMVTKSFGMAYSQTYDDYRHHAGVDLLVADTPEIYAAAAGTVKSITNTPDGRITVVLQHKGYTTTYQHLTETKLSVKEKVKQNQEIGKIHTSTDKGVNGSEHVHFEVTSQGKSIDPIQYMSQDQ